MFPPEFLSPHHVCPRTLYHDGHIVSSGENVPRNCDVEGRRKVDQVELTYSAWPAKNLITFLVIHLYRSLQLECRAPRRIVSLRRKPSCKMGPRSNEGESEPEIRSNIRLFVPGTKNRHFSDFVYEAGFQPTRSHAISSAPVHQVVITPASRNLYPLRLHIASVCRFGFDLMRSGRAYHTGSNSKQVQSEFGVSGVE